jgi:hypothetical protein
MTNTPKRAVRAIKNRAKKVQVQKMPSMALRKACFIEELRRTANISRAAREAGIGNSTVYKHRARFPAFAADWDAAIAEALDGIEESILARVRDGVDKPVFYGGEQIGSVRHYSDALSMFILKSKRPEVYNRPAAALPDEPVDADSMSEAEAEAEFDRRMALLKLK